MGDAAVACIALACSWLVLFLGFGSCLPYLGRLFRSSSMVILCTVYSGVDGAPGACSRSFVDADVAVLSLLRHFLYHISVSSCQVFSSEPDALSDILC